MRFAQICTSVVCFGLMVAPAIAETRAEIMKKFVGQWRITAGVNQGVKITEEKLEGTYTTITADTITTYDKDKKETYKAVYTLNTDTNPMQIDMMAEMGGKKMKASGIVKFEWLDLDGEDEFTLCYSLEEGKRPKEFKSPEDSKIMLFELEEGFKKE